MAAAAIHPGEQLAEELKTLDISAAELARKLHVPTTRITQILNGQRAITGDTALRLAHFFATSPEFYLNLQSLYELRLARQKAGKAIKGLPKLKRTGPARQKTHDLRRLLKAITAKNRPNATDSGPPQGKEIW
jgi:addiction module HigA family antidote